MTKLKTITRNHVKFVGVELEGYWENGHDDLKGDGSVHFDNYENEECHGYCRDECNCGEYCECNECINCDNCDNQVSECQCEGCMYCNDCNNMLDDCECIIESVCDKKSCNIDNICDECIESF